MKNYFKSIGTHWSTYTAVVLALVGFLLPSLNAYVMAHPKSVASALIAAVIMAYHAQSPNQTPPVQ